MPGSNAEQTAEFEGLFRPHMDALLRTAERLTHDRSAAEDLVQETLLKGFRFFHRFARDTNFKAWIFKILMNAFVNTYRKKQRQEVSLDGEAASETAIADEADPAADAPSLAGRERVIFDLVDDRIKQALLELPEHLRIVFMLSVVEGLKYREIADVLECPVGTVMSRLFRGRAMLRERLDDFAREEGYLD